MAKKGKKRKAAAGDLATNRQASFRYHLLDKYEAGIMLQGSEVKSIRDGGVQIKDAYAAIRDGEVWLHNMYVAPYMPASRENHDPERERKLLLKAKEIEELVGSTAQKGLTLIPTRVYLKDRRVKVEIALGRGKDQGDKRRDLKEKDVKRDIQRALAERER
jgi:SsrA-binding protein